MSRPDFTRAAILRGGSLVAGGSIISSALAAALTTILGVELGDEGFGRYAFVIATAALLGIIARLGLEPIIVRDIARSEREATPGSVSREPIVTAISLTAAMSAALALLTISPLGVAVFDAIGDLSLSITGALAVLFAAQALYTVNAESLRGLHRLGFAAFLGLPVQRLVSLVLIAWFVYFAASDLDTTLALWLTALAAVGAAGVSGFALWMQLRDLRGAGPRRRNARRMARDGAPVLLTNVLGIGRARLPIWVLAGLGAFGDAGVFALATAFVTLIGLAYKSMTGTLAPFIAASYHSGSRSALQRRIRIAAAGTSLLAIGAAIALIVIGLLAVPRLFGPDFEDAVPVASILLVGTVGEALSGPCGLLLNITGNERWMAKASLLSIGSAAVVIVPAAAAGGAIGSAVVMTATVLLKVGLQLRYVVRHTGLSTVADFRGLWRSLRRARSS